MLAREGGRVVHAAEPSIYPSQGMERIIDFFIVAVGIASLIDKVGNVHDVALSPHRAVALTF